jgi:hypothetical protein
MPSLCCCLSLRASLSLFGVLALSACCTVRRPVRSPDWITPTHPSPAARACSQFDKEIEQQMRDLRHKVEQQRRCCGNDGNCQQTLRSLGTKAWDKSLAAYEVVHTNLSVGDKVDILRANQATIDALRVCQVGNAE